jgi:hypothetical protein
MVSIHSGTYINRKVPIVESYLGPINLAQTLVYFHLK